jgi:hypothetical protein
MLPDTEYGTIHEQVAHQRQLIDLVSEFYDDPLHFVISCFPWGQPGTPGWCNAPIASPVSVNQLDAKSARGRPFKRAFLECPR